jgi:hypothetical protein
MRAYVNFYDQDGARARKTIARLTNSPEDVSIKDENFVVQFSENKPTPPIAITQSEAIRVCHDLTMANFKYVNHQEHVCHFEFEQVGETEYIIFCDTHPSIYA